MPRKNKKNAKRYFQTFKKNRKNIIAKTIHSHKKGNLRKNENQKTSLESLQATDYIKSSELEEYKNLLLNRKRIIEDLLKNRESDLLQSSLKEESGNLSGMPQHIAELGTQEYEKNFACIVLESVQKELQEILNALDKINKGNYGICENCHKPINKERLKVLSYTALCLDCKILEENSLINQ